MSKNEEEIKSQRERNGLIINRLKFFSIENLLRYRVKKSLFIILPNIELHEN